MENARSTWEILGLPYDTRLTMRTRKKTFELIILPSFKIAKQKKY